MTRLERLKRKGYRVVRVMGRGKCIAYKGSRTYMAASITALYKQILG